MGPLTRYQARIAAGDLAPDAAQADAAEHLQQLFEAMVHYSPGRGGSVFGGGFFGFGRSKVAAPRGVYLFGDVGRGKSMLMDLFFESTSFAPKRRVHFHAFMLEVHEMIGQWRGMDGKARAKHADYEKSDGDDPIAPTARGLARGAKLLCFDEFQVTDIADAMILKRLFEALFAHGVVVVATSNREPKDLYQGGLNRQLFLPFIDLVYEKLDVLHLDAEKDYRLDRIAGEPVYYAPLGPETDHLMDAMWHRLTDAERGHKHVLQVQGRDVIVPEAMMGCARFFFSELAGKPLGAADYLAIARAYHTVFVDQIPRLSAEKRNEAKRFVTFIDALYENRVKLICSAEAEPEALYRQGHGAFEFERTVSRLREMQSEDYLSLGHGMVAVAG